MPDCQPNGWSQENGRPGSYKENKTHLIHIREVISPAFVAFLIHFLFEKIKLTQPVDFMFSFFKEDCEALHSRSASETDTIQANDVTVVK